MAGPGRPDLLAARPEVCGWDIWSIRTVRLGSHLSVLFDCARTQTERSLSGHPEAENRVMKLSRLGVRVRACVRVIYEDTCTKNAM